MRHKPMALGSMTRKRDNNGVVRSGIGEGCAEGDADSGCRRLMVSEKACARSRQGIRYECPERCCIAGGARDAAIEIELQADLRIAGGTGRRHRIEPGDGSELPFERRGYGRSHGGGVGAWQASLYLNGGEIDARQIAHRQAAIRHHAE